MQNQFIIFVWTKAKGPSPLSSVANRRRRRVLRWQVYCQVETAGRSWPAIQLSVASAVWSRTFCLSAVWEHQYWNVVGCWGLWRSDEGAWDGLCVWHVGAVFWRGNVMERDHLEDQGVGGNIKEWILNIMGGRWPENGHSEWRRVVWSDSSARPSACIVDRLPIVQFGLPNLTLHSVLLKLWLVACDRI